MAQSNLTEEERYWAKVDKGGLDGCWEWTAATNRAGYGIFLARGTCVLAHRYGWRLATGDDPGELCVLHHCDNPVCQNPSHHFLGTRADNAADRNRKGRQARGERQGAAVLTEEVIHAFHARYRSGASIPQIAKEMGLQKGTLASVRRGLSWAHLGLDWGSRPGRLAPDSVRVIRERFATGESRHAIAADFHIKPKYVNEIVSRRSWASVS